MEESETILRLRRYLIHLTLLFPNAIGFDLEYCRNLFASFPSLFPLYHTKK